MPPLDQTPIELDRRVLLQSAPAAAIAPAVFMGSAPAVSAAVPAVLRLEEIAPGVFVARGSHAVINADNGGHIANMTVIVGPEAVAIIDTGGSARNGAALLAAVREKTGRPIKYVVNTHMHPDHVLGNAPFAATGTEFVAHAKLPRGLGARSERYLAHSAATLQDAFAGTRIVMPTRLIQADSELDLGGRRLLLHAHGTAHTDNDLSVRDIETATLILGDLLFSEHIPTIDGSLRGWIRELARLETEPADRVVPGHGPASLAWPAALAPERRYLETLATEIKALIAKGRPLDEAMRVAARDEGARWLLSDEYHARNIAAAYAEIEWE